MQIVAREYSSPPKKFLFCPTGCDLSRLEAKARENLVLDGTLRRHASFASSVAGILRRRHRHAAHCNSCILREVFSGGLPR
jgi:hypothetical protein